MREVPGPGSGRAEVANEAYLTPRPSTRTMVSKPEEITDPQIQSIPVCTHAPT